MTLSNQNPVSPMQRNSVIAPQRKVNALLYETGHICEGSREIPLIEIILRDSAGGIEEKAYKSRGAESNES